MLSQYQRLRKLSVYDLPLIGQMAPPSMHTLANGVLDEVYNMLQSTRKDTLKHVHLGFKPAFLIQPRSETSHHDTSFAKYNWKMFLDARCFKADTFQELSFDGIYSTTWAEARLVGAAGIQAALGELVQ